MDSEWRKRYRDVYEQAVRDEDVYRQAVQDFEAGERLRFLRECGEDVPDEEIAWYMDMDNVSEMMQFKIQEGEQQVARERESEKGESQVARERNKLLGFWLTVIVRLIRKKG